MSDIFASLRAQITSAPSSGSLCAFTCVCARLYQPLSNYIPQHRRHGLARWHIVNNRLGSLEERTRQAASDRRSNADQYAVVRTSSNACTDRDAFTSTRAYQSRLFASASAVWSGRRDASYAVCLSREPGYRNTKLHAFTNSITGSASTMGRREAIKSSPTESSRIA